MDFQDKIVFLKYLIDSAVSRINRSPYHKYTSEINISDSNLSVIITYNDIEIVRKKYTNITVDEQYDKLAKIAEQLIAGEILYRSTEQNIGTITITSNHA